MPGWTASRHHLPAFHFEVAGLSECSHINNLSLSMCVVQEREIQQVREWQRCMHNYCGAGRCVKDSRHGRRHQRLWPAAQWPDATQRRRQTCCCVAKLFVARLASDGDPPRAQVLPVLFSPALQQKLPQPRDVLCSRERREPVLLVFSQRAGLNWDQVHWLRSGRRDARPRRGCCAVQPSGNLLPGAGRRGAGRVPCEGADRPGVMQQADRPDAMQVSRPAAASRSWCPRPRAQKGSLGRLHSAASCRQGTGRRGQRRRMSPLPVGARATGAPGGCAGKLAWFAQRFGLRGAGTAGCACTHAPLAPCGLAQHAGRCHAHLLAMRHVNHLVLQALRQAHAPP